MKLTYFSPKDIWIMNYYYYYYFYHWNGTDYQQMTVPGLPMPDASSGIQTRMVKTKSGKVFLPSEVSSKVYVIAQGTP